MKISHLLAASLIVCVMPASAFADSKAPAQCPFHHQDAQVQPQAKEKETPLAKEMSKMNKHYKALKKNVGKADKKAVNVADFNGVAEAAKKCKEYVPESANTDALKKQYAESLDKVVDAAKEGAKATQEGKLEDAKKAYEKLSDLKKAGHKKFKPEDE